jgi:hypothetical protein
MEEKKVLTQEEKQELSNIQTQTQQLITELGEIELMRLQLEKRKEKAIQLLEKTTLEESTFTQNILNKYGKCNIDPQTGEIVLIS